MIKKLFFVLALSALAFSCSKDDDETPAPPSKDIVIENLILPESSANTPLDPTKDIIIKGKGFKQGDIITFKEITVGGTIAVLGTVKSVTDEGITVTPHPSVMKKQEITLKREGMNNKKLGEIFFIGE